MDNAITISAQIAVSKDLTASFRRSGRPNSHGFSEVGEYQSAFERLARGLCRKGAAHAVVIADRGIDAEAFVADFARLAAGEWLPFLAEKHVVIVDARHTVPDESRERLLAILASVAKHDNGIICISGFDTLLRTSRGGNRDVLLCALESVSCSIVGIVPPNAYEELIAGDVEMEARFTSVELQEPSLESAKRIVGEYALTLTEAYKVNLSADVVEMATVLSNNYILSEKLPGKARKVLQRLCEEVSFDRNQMRQRREDPSVDDVVKVVSEVSGVPAETLRGIAEKRDYAKSLKEFIVGQDHAVLEMAEELGLIKAGLTDQNKPASVVLFVGQTGTGKTEMAKALSRMYSNAKRLRTYTLGNMVEPHSVSAIIGVPPGYVGHENGGKIVHDLISDPNCVFLLDEADKAHPDVLQPFLNLFDEGWIRDQKGVQAFANKAIFVLTTNVGQRMIQDMAKQGKSPDEIASRMRETLAQIKHAKANRPVFAPEFLARIKRVIVFQPLSKEAMSEICSMCLKSSKRNWREQRQKHLEIASLLEESIAVEAHRRNELSNGKEGGRIVKKLISQFVDVPLQRAISEAPDVYKQCQSIIVDARKNERFEEHGDVQVEALNELSIEVRFEQA